MAESARSTRTRVRTSTILLALLLVACSDGGNGGPSGPPQPGPPAVIGSSGSGQSGAAGGVLPSPLVVTVTDAQNRPVPGVTVTWATEDGSIAPATGTTGASGQAQATWTLAPRLGVQTATATAGALTASFTATGAAPATTALVRLGGDAQSDTVTALLRDTLAVEVRLPSGQGLRDVAVTWTVAAGGGTITPLSETTDAAGRARAVWRLGTTADENRVTVSAPELQPTTFTATAQPGAAHSIIITPDSLLLDAWGDTARFAALAHDRFSNVAQAQITWSASDTTVARITGGLVTSHRAGRTAITAAAGAVTASRFVNVPLQRNAQCSVPAHTPRGPAHGVPAFSDVIFLTPDGILPPTWPGARSIAVDIDGDGDEDIIRLEYSFPGNSPYSGEVRIFVNDNGTLRDATAQLLATPIVPDHPRDFEVADFTGNGSADVYVAQHGFDAPPFPGAPNLLLTFQGGRVVNRAPAAFAPYSTTGFTHGSAAGDVDCDGDIDLIELNLTATPNFLFLNNGSGNFAPAPAGAFPFGGVGQTTMQRWQEVAFIDIDGDGDPDMFLGARSGNGWNESVILVNDGFGRFRQTNSIRLPAPRFTPHHAINNAKAADFDGDGLEDLILFEIPEPFSTTSAIRLWLNQGDGSFVDHSVAWGLPQLCTGEVVEPLHVVDINRDGWPDIVVPPGCDQLQPGLLINRGNRFDYFPFSSIQPWLDGVATPIDVDGDGWKDLFFGERGGDAVLIMNRR